MNISMNVRNNISHSFSYGFSRPDSSRSDSDVTRVSNRQKNGYQTNTQTNSQTNSQSDNQFTHQNQAVPGGASDGRDISSYLRKRKANKAGINVNVYTDKEGRVHKTYTGQSTSVVDSMKATRTDNNDERVKVKKHLRYSYQKVSGQILMAKNSFSASKAVLMARRSLAELKRSIKKSDCSEDEKQAALAHANSMLRIARKKKKNLELEELIDKTIKFDEKNKKINNCSEEPPFIISEDEEKAKSDEDRILNELLGTSGKEESGSNGRNAGNIANELPGEEMGVTAYRSESMSADMLGEMSADMLGEMSADMLGEMSADMLGEMSADMLGEMSEDMLDEMSAELNDMMESLSVINPHMDEEHLDKLKTKHRCEEQKQVVKANTEYLKAYIKAVQEEQNAMSAGAGNTGTTQVAPLALPPVSDAAFIDVLC